MTRPGAGSTRTVVATEAAIDDAVVAEAGRLPCDSHVAGVAGGRRRYVQCVLARCRLAVVTRRTGAADLRVVHAGDRRPVPGRMTRLAGVGRLEVRHRLARGREAVVAGDTVAGDA